MLFALPSFGSWFRVQGSGVRKGSHLGDMLRVLELAVLYYDTSSPVEKGRAKGAGWIYEAV